MKIRSCEIKSFGKLEDKNIILDDGITVIRGKNESGKSTLSAFIKYVLYGFAGKGRDERNNEKLKYTPWSGAKSAGALILEDEKSDIYRAERSGTKGKILNFQGSACFDGYDAGEVFYGMDQAAFSKSSFVGQNDIEPDDMKDLGASLEKLLMGSEKDDTDFDKAKKTLNAERNKLYNKMRNTGRILELGAAIDDLKRKREEQSENNRRLNTNEFTLSETERKYAENTERLEKIYAESDNIEAYKACETLEKISAAEKKYRASADRYFEASKHYAIGGFVPDRIYLDSLSRACSDYSSALPELAASERELREAEKRYSELAEKLHESNNFGTEIEKDSSVVENVYDSAVKLSGKVKKLKICAIVFLCLVLTIPVSIVLFALMAGSSKKLAALLKEYGFADMQALETFYGYYKTIYPQLVRCTDEIRIKTEAYDSQKLKLSASEELLLAKLMKTGYVQDTSEIRERFSDIRDKLLPELGIAVASTETAFAEYSADKKAYETLLSVSSIEELRQIAAKRQDEPPKRTREEIDRAIKFEESARALLEKKLSELRTETARLGAIVSDPEAIEDRIFRLEEELTEAKLHNDALELAMELIEKARDDIRGNVFPQISERAGELFSKFTGGKYRGLFFDKDFAVRVLESDDTETRSIGYLSSGAIDTAYIALRVALAEYLCKSKPTLIFDDSFAKIDDDRLSNILDVLVTLSEEYQIVILTCHDREERMLCGRCKALVLEEEQ